jgi:hypothetical protein
MHSTKSTLIKESKLDTNAIFILQLLILLKASVSESQW